MKSMIIVDDNIMDRVGISKLIDWQALGIKPVGQFRSGQHALEKMDELRPDIVLTDIQMPIMNGIELTRLLKEHYPHVTVVFMSSYEQFEYAKSALHLGVEEYILKPVIARELQETFHKIVQKLQRNEQLQEEKSVMVRQLQEAVPLYQEQFFKDYLFHGLSFESEAKIRSRMQSLLIQVPDNPACYVVQLDLRGKIEPQANGPALLESFSIPYTIKQLLQPVHSPSFTIYSIQLSSSSYTFCIFMDANQDQEEKLAELFAGIQEMLAGSYGLEAAVGISSSVNRLSEVPNLYNQALTAVRTLASSSSKRPVLYRLIDDNHWPPQESVDYQKLFGLIKDIVFVDLQGGLARLIEEFVDGVPFRSEAYMQELRISVLNITQHMLGDIHRPFEEIEPVLADLRQPVRWSAFREWVYKVMVAAKEQLQSHSRNEYDQIVDDIKRIIDSRLHEPITLQDIAAAIFLSPSHMNNIFKARMGRTVFDHLIECRMEAAKKKLLIPSSRIYLVAREVGYTNKSHFCLLFKKYTGLTPTDYKNRALAL